MKSDRALEKINKDYSNIRILPDIPLLILNPHDTITIESKQKRVTPNGLNALLQSAESWGLPQKK